MEFIGDSSADDEWFFRAQEENEHNQAIKNAFIEELRACQALLGLSLRGIFDDNVVLMSVVDRVEVNLAAQGIAIDSLEGVAILSEIEEEYSAGQDDEDQEDEGGLGVREPRRPAPSAGSGTISLPPELH